MTKRLLGHSFLSFFLSFSTLAASSGVSDIDGILLGHESSEKFKTGVTVLKFKWPMGVGVSVKGAAPASRELAALKVGNLVSKVHALVLTGGSAFGLSSADGVMQCLREEGKGFPVGPSKVIPVVPTAAIFDMASSDSDVFPGKNWGYKACQKAKMKNDEEGNVGAGTGATVGKIFGRERAMKGGLGQSYLKRGIIEVAALAVVNAVGDVVSDKDAEILAGAREEEKNQMLNAWENFLKKDHSEVKDLFEKQNTTLVVVATNIDLGKEKLSRLAQTAHNGMARVIRPVHTAYDGDIIFSVSNGKVKIADTPENDLILQILFEEAVAKAIQNGVIKACSLGKFPSYRDRIELKGRQLGLE